MKVMNVLLSWWLFGLGGALYGLSLYVWILATAGGRSDILGMILSILVTAPGFWSVYLAVEEAKKV